MVVNVFSSINNDVYCCKGKFPQKKCILYIDFISVNRFGNYQNWLWTSYLLRWWAS